MGTWLQYRVDLEKPVRKQSWQALLTSLAVLDDEQLDACVADSIAQGWFKLFPEKFTLPPPTGSEAEQAKNREKKEGAAPPRIPPAEFPWRELARDHLGDDLVGTWEEQTARTRQRLRDVWRDLSAASKNAIMVLAESQNEREPVEGEKKEGGADA